MFYVTYHTNIIPHSEHKYKAFLSVVARFYFISKSSFLCCVVLIDRKANSQKVNKSVSQVLMSKKSGTIRINLKLMIGDQELNYQTTQPGVTISVLLASTSHPSLMCSLGFTGW